MKFFHNALAVILLTYVLANPVLTDDPRLGGYDDFINKILKDWHSPGIAVAIIKDGEIIFGEGFGFRNISANQPVTPQTLFAIASCSKAFTTTALAMLVEDNLIEWDKPVRDYLPEFRMADSYITEHITVRDLVTHRSGLARHDRVWLGTPFTREELVHKIQYLDFSKGFREAYQYNNLLYITAGRVIEAVTGISWESFIDHRILKPLGMTGTNFSVTDMQLADDFAQAYTIGGNNLTLAPFRNVDAIGPAGSINSNLSDMTKWVQFNLNRGIVMLDTLLSPAHFEELQTPWVVAAANSSDKEFSSSSYGLGWRITTYRGHRIIYHAGAIGAYRALVTLLPDHDIGIISLTNYNRAQVNRIVTYNAIDRLLDMSQIDWNTRLIRRITAPREHECHVLPRLSHELHEYTGSYEHPAYGEITITNSDNRLIVTRYGETSKLEHCKYNMFRRERGYWGAFSSGTKFTFFASEDDDIDRVLISLDSTVADIEFKRILLDN